MNKFTPFLIAFITSLTAFIFFHILPLLIVDPLNITDIEVTENEFYIKEMRFQAATIINKVDFDSAIVGTSMAENFSPKEASDKLGGVFTNLSMHGSLFKERNVVLDYMLSEKEIKTVIFSLDGASNIQRNKGIPIEAWSFLYNKNILDDFYVYTNRKYSTYISCHSLFNDDIFAMMYGECPHKKVRSTLENLTEWQTSPYQNNRFGGVDNWVKHKDNAQVKMSIEALNDARQLVEENTFAINEELSLIHDPSSFSRDVVPLVREHSNTNFLFFFPPFSIYKYAIDVQTNPQEFVQYKKLVERVVLEAELYSNADVYWFADKKYINNISNYKDLTHYNGGFNSFFLSEFSAKRSIINSSNYKQLLTDLENRAKNTDIVDLAKKLKVK